MRVVPPEYELFPPKTNVAAPVLERMPVVLAILPERVAVPDATLTVPVPSALMLIGLLALMRLFNANVVPVVIVKVPVPRPELWDNVICPAVRVVPPECALFPPKTKVAAPVLERMPVVLAVLPERVAVPDATLTAPVPKLLMLILLLALMRSFKASIDPFAIVSVLEPSPVLLASVIWPVVIVVPPA